MPAPLGEETTGPHVAGSVLMTHPVGLHARPSVKLTKLAKTFSAGIGLALAVDGPWIDAKSIVKVMATKAPGNSVLYFRASGTDAEEAVQALVALVEHDFGDGSDGAGMCEVRGRPAAPGVGLGPLVVLAGTPGVRPHSGDPDRESAALRAALAAAAASLGRIVRPGDNAEATAVLEFQLAMLQDEALVVPALSAIAGGAAADTAWLTAVDAQIRDYEMAAEEYFRARSADLRDLRDRVCRILTGAEELAPMPPGAILAAEDLMPSIFLEIDWRPRGRAGPHRRQRLESCRDAGARAGGADGHRPGSGRPRPPPTGHRRR